MFFRYYVFLLLHLIPLTVASPLQAQSFNTQPAKITTFSLFSPEIPADSMIGPDFIFNGFGCTGKNISPPLRWENSPKNTKSFAVTVYDPDAPTGSGWWHWIIYDLHAFSTGLPKGIGSGMVGIPKHTQQGMNDYGTLNYGGPCPPVGDPVHHYIFTVHALKVEKLEIPSPATAAMISFAINANTIEKASFRATYSRIK